MASSWGSPVSPPSFCSTPLPKMPKMSVAERLLMLRKMRQASLEKRVATEASSAVAMGQEQITNNNAIDGLESMASETPEFPMPTSDEATHPRPRAEASHDPVESPSWDVQRQISRQIEYYFGDYNLPRDKFMLDLMLEDEGWISMNKMTTFPRLAALSKDPDVIMDAIESFGQGQLMQVDRDLCRMRRNPGNPLPKYTEEWIKDVESRSLFVAGFSRSVTQDELINFFDRNFEGVCNMRMRRRDRDPTDDPNGPSPFIGSCFVTFETRETAQKCFDRKLGLMYKNRSLLTMWKSDFHAQRSFFNDEFDPVVLERTVWVHGFDKVETQAEELNDFFCRFPGAESIKKRVFRANPDERWKFSGGVFVTFETIEDAKEFMALTEVRLDNGDKLLKKWQEDFFRERGRFKKELGDFRGEN